MTNGITKQVDRKTAIEFLRKELETLPLMVPIKFKIMLKVIIDLLEDET